jgi:hypothetical protein
MDGLRRELPVIVRAQREMPFVRDASGVPVAVAAIPRKEQDQPPGR